MANSYNDRIVVLIDMDCFFCQVETKLQPEYTEKPLAVVQYNQWQLGGIIAVNYEAREYGVTRHMRGEEAKEKCPNLILASVPCLRGKADTSRYRSAGRDVIDVIKQHCNIIERASVDEAYLDVTDIVNTRMSTNSNSLEYLVTKLSHTFVVGYTEVGKNNEEERSQGTRTWITNVFKELEDVQAQKLAIAGIIVEEIRSDIFNKTGFKCSAGIAQNKILAKLACGLHKPNQQTILPATAVSSLYSTLPIKKVRNLGGKFGDIVIESLNCNVMGDLLQYSLQYLQKRFDDKTGLWLHNIARGIDNEPVTTRLVSKSIGACKKFPGKQAITSLDLLQHWAGELSAEVCERLEQDLAENERRATLVTICYHYYQNKTTVSQSRSYILNSYKPEKMATRCVEIVSKSTQHPIAYLGISAGKFIPAKGSKNFRNFFKSSKLEYHQEINVQTEITHSVNNATEAITNNLNLNKITNIDSNNDEVNVARNKLKDIQNSSKFSVQLNEEILNTQTEWSPTSTRLNNLINSLNERNKKKVLYEKKASSSNLNNSLDQNDFKESFFMTAFNSKESKLKDTHTYNTELIELNNNRNMYIECENLNENNIKKDEEDNSDGELDVNSREYNYKKCMDNKNGKESSSANVKLDKSNKATSMQKIIKLEEIFPDLNNIDPTVVALLPSDLQEQAKSYMSAQNKKNNTKKISVKISKGKGKSKTNTSKRKKNNDISSFLIKRNSSYFTEIPSKQCLQCYQMIPISKYLEHCDFHVAESLQREINNSILQSVNVKRKVDIVDKDVNSIKRPPNEDISKISME
ncbi:DNA polymerase eta [Habropoda laboriosa]|uniref:DNA polymerase eta n=1 Tax=Habropoda laboriosa TaxID=597456 RepID=A0A0L7QMI7_9HYME|nr:PREDICTED: DNA polymerase eta [Habropoda laboriosa]KOC59820.1 DNA polymerase eta [Habropoda laboriosa]